MPTLANAKQNAIARSLSSSQLSQQSAELEVRRRHDADHAPVKVVVRVVVARFAARDAGGGEGIGGAAGSTGRGLRSLRDGVRGFDGPRRGVVVFAAPESAREMKSVVAAMSITNWIAVNSSKE